MPGCHRGRPLLAYRMFIRIAGRTDVGRSRERNEDALLQRPDRGLIAVADGMGGHAAGDIASRIAVDVVDDRSAHSPGDDESDYFRDTVHQAHQAILKASRADPELEGMGTTLTLLRLNSGGTRGVIAHVGDSRAYRWRAGALEQLTHDQTWVQQQVDSGRLTPESARTHPFSSMLTCALGIEGVDLDVQVIDPEPRPGDVFLLCSDGLTAALLDDDLRRILREHEDIDDAARELVDAANEAGGPDNITVAMARIEEEG